MTKFCASCGTEVDETAVFCPTCGQPIDQESDSAMPPAPSWPNPEPAAVAGRHERHESFDSETAREAQPDPEPEPAEPEPEPADREPVRRVEPELYDDLPDAELTRVEERPSPPADESPPPSAAASAPVASARVAPPAAARTPKPAMDLPITTPVTMSGWLIGGGAAVAAIGALLALFDGLGTAIDLVLLIGLIAVAASVFLSDRLPNVPHLRLATLAIVLVAFGVALDRLGFGRAGAGELLLFLGTAAAAIGAILLETGKDQPLGGPSA